MLYPDVTRLYKYCSYNKNSLHFLINRKIWFSNPEYFNDPFDCKYQFKTDTDKAEFENYARKHNPERLEELMSFINDDDEKEVYNKIVAKLTYDVYEELKKAGVFCLSEHNNNILLWSHYADAHKGFCIEFERCKDRDNDLGDYRTTRRVEYIPRDYEKVTVLNEKSWDMKFFTKALDWEYEREWRLINEKSEETGRLPGKITAIIFGLRMCSEHKKTIKEILSDLPNVNYYQAEEVPNQYRIKIVDAR